MGETPFTVKAFYEYLGRNELRGVRCCNCDKVTIPPRPLCPHCLSSDLGWFRSQGRGRLETFTIIHIPLAPLSDKAPYIVGLIRLDEGPMITGRILIDPERVKDIRLGLKLELSPLKEGDRWIAAFKPVYS